MAFIVKEIRCWKCNKKLAEADYRQIRIKCPRCGSMTSLKAPEPPIQAAALKKECPDEPDP